MFFSSKKQNKIEESKDSGWVDLQQCFYFRKFSKSLEKYKGLIIYQYIYIYWYKLFDEMYKW